MRHTLTATFVFALAFVFHAPPALADAGATGKTIRAA
jgi:hypothetical protein